jgi:hypothetical protein
MKSMGLTANARLLLWDSYWGLGWTVHDATLLTEALTALLVEWYLKDFLPAFRLARIHEWAGLGPEFHVAARTQCAADSTYMAELAPHTRNHPEAEGTNLYAFWINRHGTSSAGTRLTMLAIVDIRDGRIICLVGPFDGSTSDQAMAKRDEVRNAFAGLGVKIIGDKGFTDIDSLPDYEVFAEIKHPRSQEDVVRNDRIAAFRYINECVFCRFQVMFRHGWSVWMGNEEMAKKIFIVAFIFVDESIEHHALHRVVKFEDRVAAGWYALKRAQEHEEQMEAGIALPRGSKWEERLLGRGLDDQQVEAILAGMPADRIKAVRERELVMFV